MEDLVSESDLVVIGSAVKIEHRKNTRGKIVRSVGFKVDEYVVGKGPAQIVLRLAGGTIGNVRSRVFGEVDLNVNEDVLLFIKKTLSAGEPGYYIVGMGQGCFNVAANVQTGERFVSQVLEGVNLVDEVEDDPMGIGRSGVCVFVSLKRFVSRIRKILGITETPTDD
ncbi:MAG: hypothetical protein GY762_16810 [Proteobacteria bacterium]|nr:hypothetical protein [Pseudomonadota bacterium]